MVATAHRPVLIVIAGPNGSGKTTITTQILQHEWMEDAIYINPDQIAKDRFGDWNSPDAIMQSVKYCEAIREDCLRERKSLIFETVLAHPDFSVAVTSVRHKHPYMPAPPTGLVGFVAVWSDLSPFGRICNPTTGI